MNSFRLTTPVAFFFFNRPETTKKVFEEIRKAKPQKLFLISDGPRLGNYPDKEKNDECKKIVNQIDWDCEVTHNYSKENLGCKLRISSGITWVFQNVEEAIILEDDCLPVQSFFLYCQEILNYYRFDERIMIISGNNFQNGRKVNSSSYYFSTYSYIWGWATWKRSWMKYDINMKQWPEIKKQKYLDYWLSGKKAVEHWNEEFDKTYEGKINTWDFQFFYSCIVNQAVCIVPEVNLVTNIGFGAGSSHTGDKNSKSANIPAEDINFPLRHPEFIMRNMVADIYDEKNYIIPALYRRIFRKVRKKIVLRKL